jgi:predicted molibdopterin-dependent oxidoreductase YjgC
VRTNLLIGQSADVDTSCPEYKVVAVAVTPLAARPEPELAVAAAAQ